MANNINNCLRTGWHSNQYPWPQPLSARIHFLYCNHIILPKTCFQHANYLLRKANGFLISVRYYLAWHSSSSRIRPLSIYLNVFPIIIKTYPGPSQFILSSFLNSSLCSFCSNLHPPLRACPYTCTHVHAHSRAHTQYPFSYTSTKHTYSSGPEAVLLPVLNHARPCWYLFSWTYIGLIDT